MILKCFIELLFLLSNILAIFSLIDFQEWGLCWLNRLTKKTFGYVSNMLNDLPISFGVMISCILFYHAKIIKNSLIFLSLCKLQLYIVY